MSPSVPQPATVASAPAIPYKRDGGGAADGLGGGAAAVLVLSLLVIGAVLYLRKRLNLAPLPGGASGGLLRVLERHPLGPRAVLVVVEFEGRRHVLAHTEHGVARVIGGTPGEQA